MPNEQVDHFLILFVEITLCKQGTESKFMQKSEKIRSDSFQKIPAENDKKSITAKGVGIPQISHYYVVP